MKTGEELIIENLFKEAERANLLIKKLQEENANIVEVVEWSEVRKLIKAIREKYGVPMCEGLPYEPKTIKVQLIAKEQ